MPPTPLRPDDVPFTQFLRPDGRQRKVAIVRSQVIADKARALIRSGCKFECEELRTGEASFTCEHGEDVLAIEVVPNGPQVPEAVDRVVDMAFAVWTQTHGTTPG